MKKIDHEHLIHLEEIYETSKVSAPVVTLKKKSNNIIAMLRVKYV